MSIFVTRLNELRGDASVSAFARLAQIPQPSMDKYLTGRSPSIDILIKLSCRFGVASDWLLGLTDGRAPGGAVTSDARIAELEKKVIRLEGENSALQKALAIVGGHRALPVKSGGSSATKTA